MSKRCVAYQLATKGQNITAEREQLDRDFNFLQTRVKKENFNKKEQAQHVNNLQVKCPDENNKFVMHCLSWF